MGQRYVEVEKGWSCWDSRRLILRRNPRVTGVLVIALQNATKIMPALMGLDKEYVALMQLHTNVSNSELRETVTSYTGEIIQKPPKKSSVKRVEREREIYEMEILERENKNVLLRIKCEAGTYIRKLVHDMGQLIGGAHLKELRRTSTGSFTEDMTIKLQDLKDSYVFWKENSIETELRKMILPVEAGVEHLKKVLIKDTAIDAVTHGAPLGAGGISKVEKGIKKGTLVGLMSLKGELVALGEANLTSEEMIGKKKGMAVSLKRVVMDKHVYPETWKS